MIFDSLQNVRQELQNSDVEVQQLATSAASLMEAAEVTNAILVNSAEDSYHQTFYNIASDAAKRISTAFEQAIASNKINTGKLFDRRYVEIPNTNPQKYSTLYHKLADQLLPGIQEPALKSNNAIIYVIATDPNGYVPTHNSQFAKPPTGNFDIDLVSSRSKRLFNDRTGIRCGAHTEKMLLQTYKRDTGEIMHDLSVPIFCRWQALGRDPYWLQA